MKNRITTFIALLFINLFLLSSRCEAQSGSLDLTFDNDGKVTTAIGIGSEIANAIAIQSDGKIVVAGQSFSGGLVVFTVVRYHTNGSLDTSFDTDGIVTTSIGTGTSVANAIAIQNDGKIVVAGTSITSTNNDFTVVRYHTNGSLDNSFDTDGIATTAIGSLNEYAYGIEIQGNGKILVAGNSNNGINDDYALVRYNTDGSLDNSFDLDGKVTTGLGTGLDIGRTLAVQNDGKIVMGGYTSSGTSTNTDFGLVRYNIDGSLDSTFDIDGIVITSIGTSIESISKVLIQNDGKIVAAGSSFNVSNYDFALARYNTDGSLDNTFDTDGKVTAWIGSLNDRAFGSALQSDGKIVVAGGSGMPGSNDDISVARFNTNGSLDNSFDLDGKVTTAIGSSNDNANAIAIQGDGKIVVAGYSINGANNDIALVRYNVSMTTKIEDINEESFAFQVFPNPVHHSAELQFNREVISGEINLYNSLGEKVKNLSNLNIKVGDILNLQCNNLTEGIYFLELKEEKKVIMKTNILIRK